GRDPALRRGIALSRALRHGKARLGARPVGAGRRAAAPLLRHHCRGPEEAGAAAGAMARFLSRLEPAGRSAECLTSTRWLSSGSGSNRCPLIRATRSSVKLPLTL